MNASSVLIGFFLLAFVAFITIIVVSIAVAKRKRLTTETKKELRTALSKLEKVDDPHRRVLDADKIFDRLLLAWGVSGTFAEKFKQVESRFSNKEAIWSAHKLRNRIAHEVHIELLPGEADRAVRVLTEAVKKYVK